MATSWFYDLDEGELGPIDSVTLKQLVADGTVGMDTLVKKGENGAWTAAKRIRGLFPESPIVLDLDDSPETASETVSPATPQRPAPPQATNLSAQVADHADLELEEVSEGTKHEFLNFLAVFYNVTAAVVAILGMLMMGYAVLIVATNESATAGELIASAGSVFVGGMTLLGTAVSMTVLAGLVLVFLDIETNTRSAAVATVNTLKIMKATYLADARHQETRFEPED